jgi:hypothetical protein
MYCATSKTVVSSAARSALAIATRDSAGEADGIMGHSQGRTNVQKRKARRKKTERLAAAKKSKKTGK